MGHPRVTILLFLPPHRIMHCTVVYPLDLYPAFFGYYFFNTMMAVLLTLHVFWAYLIIRMAQKFITGKASWQSWGALPPTLHWVSWGSLPRPCRTGHMAAAAAG